MRRSEYLSELLRQRPEWLRGSMAERCANRRDEGASELSAGLERL